MKKGIIFSGMVVILALIILSGCSYLEQRKGIEKCKFEIESAKLGQLSLNGVNLKLKINISNPNKTKVILDRFDFEVFANNKFIASGSNPDKFEIGPSSNYMLATNLFLSYSSLGNYIKELVAKDKITYKVKGNVYFDTPLGALKYPVEITKIEKR